MEQQRFMELTFDQLKDLIHKYELPIYGKACSVCDKWSCDECEICPACHERKLYDVLDQVFQEWFEYKSSINK